ncbi:CoA transferase [Verticiella sediminum]|uniref:CoA transferase n=1 Tax=Verticiella sediminum TaxID=1247510 RepID=A0A556AB84_9BURK|nr:CoA transferase [Verticiella sediminum]TSH90154.1 CoA transferase [Verticiella sediminum]
MSHAPAQPLAGIRVLELGQVLAGPFAGSILADLGAEVLKIERVEGGDDARRMGRDFRHGDALTFHIFNRGKQSIALDLTAEPGLAAFETLAAQADILVHNLRPGVVEKLGIDGPALCARHPRLIYCEISAFGHAGEHAGKPGYEPLIQAYSGLSSTNGGPDDPPTRVGASICDQGSGMWAVLGALALLQRRHLTGRGGIVQTSLLETALSWAAQKADAYVNEGKLPERHASGHPGMVPYEAFDTADLPVLVCCGNDRLFAKFAQLMEHDDWLADERYATNRARLQHKEPLLAQIRERLAQAPREVWLERLSAAGIPCAPVHSLPEALAEPHVQALGLHAQVPGEDFTLTALPLSLDGQRPLPAHAAPRLGEHNACHGIAAHPAP